MNESLPRNHGRRAKPKDETWFARLLWETLAANWRIYAPTDFSRTLGNIVISYMETWPDGAGPETVIVLGEAYASDMAAARACGAEHRFVQAGLADPDERVMLSLRGQFVLFNPALAHSQLRWLDSKGDRTIVVLPPEYDRP